MLKEHIKSLSNYGSADVSDILDNLYPGKQFHLEGLTYIAGSSKDRKPLVGEICTVEIVEIQSDVPSEINPELHWIDQIRSNSVLLIQAPLTSKHALFGGLLSRRAHYLECPGVVALGNVRDVDEMDHVGMKVFSKGTSPLRSRGRGKVVRIGKSIVVDGLRVEDGDILIGDKDGVIIFPKVALEEVLKLCESNAKVEKKCKDALKRGMSTTEAFKLFEE